MDRANMAKRLGLQKQQTIKVLALVFFFLLATAGATSLTLMKHNKHSQSKPSVSKASFGTTPQGQPVDLYTLTNSHGMEVRITNFGAILVSMRVPDRSSKLDDVVLGFDD